MAQTMDGAAIRREAAAPMKGMVIILTEGPWGSAADAGREISSLSAGHGMTVTGMHDMDGMLRVGLSGGADDMAYLRMADEVFSSLSEYLPQMIPMTEEDE